MIDSHLSDILKAVRIAQVETDPDGKAELETPASITIIETATSLLYIIIRKENVKLGTIFVK